MATTAAEKLANVKNALRNKYAWPGGYPLFIVMSDGEAMSIDAARGNWREICRSTIAHSRDGWAVEGAEINWEDGELYCCHSNVRIESAYAEPETEESSHA